MPLSTLPLTVLALGVVSFFTDVGSEMIFPLLPVFLSDCLRASPSSLGLIEGAADVASSLLKLASGLLSDRWARRKPLVLLGYTLASAARPLVALAQTPWHLLAIRLTDRVGKGLRTSPRDALLADVAPEGQAGRVFGFHRAMDHTGAVVGPLIASGLLGLGLPLRTIFWCTAVPGVLCIVVLLGVREPPPSRHAGAPDAPAAPLAPPLPRALGLYFGILLLFSLGNSSDAFLLLRARELGVGTAALPVLWTALHLYKLLCSYGGGVLSDLWPRWRLIVGGWMVYSATYLGLALAHRRWQVWLLFVLYGVFYGLTEPVEKALVKDLAPALARGRAFGIYHFIVGGSALPAGLLTGWLWQSRGPSTALMTGAVLASLAALLMLAWSQRDRLRPRTSVT
jgi:MFS family permease